MFKAVVSDLDGTLISSSGELTFKTLEAIKKIQNNGIKFVILSGRRYEEIKSILIKYNLSCDVVGLNGAEFVYDNKRYISKDNIINEDLVKIISKCEMESILYKVYSNKEIIFKEYDDIIYKLIELAKLYYNDVPSILICAYNLYNSICGNCIIESDIIDYLDQSKSKAFKIEVLSPIEKKLNIIRDEVMKCNDLNVTSSNSLNIEIMSKYIDKGQAVKRISKVLGLDIKEIIGIGDNFNDLAMFNNVGLSVAMGNAPEEIKKKVNYVTKTNDEDGIAEVIDRFILCAELSS